MGGETIPGIERWSEISIEDPALAAHGHNVDAEFVVDPVIGEVKVGFSLCHGAAIAPDEGFPTYDFFEIDMGFDGPGSG